ncbi:MAG: ATP-dependent DNA helicase [Propionibacteriaceae bacterium]|jgi:ATP-dependent DNA helicase DinG|nr:ATP-dependent DNA helicase [Propionibacteriaceae bacterium]
MVELIDRAIGAGRHALIQAGTGTGKSLAYLAPAAAWLVAQPDSTVVVATATLALQAQLATRDIPTIVAATEQVTGRQLSWSLLKGRSNYACLLRLRDQAGADLDQGELVEGAELVEVLRAGGADRLSLLGAEVVALRRWAEDELEAGRPGDRDDAPSHSPKAWSLVSMPGGECPGAQSCPHIAHCFAETARERARASDLVVTNHALVAIEAADGVVGLPGHDLMVIDEAHELPSRATSAASQELSPALVERIVRRAATWLSEEALDDLRQAGRDLERALDEAEAGRVTAPAGAIAQACAQLRQAARQAVGQLGRGSEPERGQAANIVQEVSQVAERMAALAADDVVWVALSESLGPRLVVAPLSVAEGLRRGLLNDAVVVMTSATLTVGGGFESLAQAVGLRAAEQEDPAEPSGAGGAVVPPADQAQPDQTTGPTDDPAQPWWAADVGSPFDYPRQGIGYVARHLPPPGRDGISPQALTEIGRLLEASGGHALGLFSSTRAAQAAAAWVRQESDWPVLCQGEGHLADLVRQFIDQPVTSLFGTIALWQGLDVPGTTCQLVIIDRIPFPRPDEPLIQARQRAVDRSGGNGFMTVCAGQAGLLLAQGAGRLIRRLDDRGVVAILDRRLVTARYGPYLTRSLPPFWLTTDPDQALDALRRLRRGRPSAASSAAVQSSQPVLESDPGTAPEL